MALYVPDVGEVRLLARALGQVANGNATLKLYTNDYTPVQGSTHANFTEMAGQDYAAKTLTAGSWSASSVGNVGTGVYAQQIWTFTAGGPTVVYGYFIVDAADGVLMYAERFAVPPTIQYDGDQIKVTPTVTLATVP